MSNGRYRVPDNGHAVPDSPDDVRPGSGPDDLPVRVYQVPADADALRDGLHVVGVEDRQVLAV